MRRIQTAAAVAYASLLAGWAGAIVGAFFPPLTAPCTLLCVAGAGLVGFGAGALFGRETREEADDDVRL